MQIDAVRPADGRQEHSADGRSVQEAPAQDRLRWGMVEFQVRDIIRSTAFWCDVLGFVDRGRNAGGKALGTTEETLVILHEGAGGPVDRRAAGLYHVAFGVPDQIEFSRLLARFSHQRQMFSPIDHTMSKAIYLNDPDGIGIEFALETPERFGRFSEMTHDFSVYDSDGCRRSGRDLLDVRAELKRLAEGTNLSRPIASGTCVAHLHFQVPRIEEALDYFQAVGFARNLFLPHFGFADMSAGSAYTHRLAFNLWAGRDILPPDSDSARLIRYSLFAEGVTDDCLRSDPFDIDMLLRPLVKD
ncbi:VOC family protein [Rhizobium sp. FY34]|uniref:VOC family protein n=1 Tax=Rhizobium sp. FY34 TaxID=2562309 RepID=UPI0010C11AA6|nr:VOC family protein [Rhizobium sp. FY34]